MRLKDTEVMDCTQLTQDEKLLDWFIDWFWWTFGPHSCLLMLLNPFR